jgi:hypothetical protein
LTTRVRTLPSPPSSLSTDSPLAVDYGFDDDKFGDFKGSFDKGDDGKFGKFGGYESPFGEVSGYRV